MTKLRVRKNYTRGLELRTEAGCRGQWLMTEGIGFSLYGLTKEGKKTLKSVFLFSLSFTLKLAYMILISLQIRVQNLPEAFENMVC